MCVARSESIAPPGPNAPCDLDRLDNKLELMQTLWERYGDCYRVRAESRPVSTYVINHPDWVKRVLVSNHRNYTKGVGMERVRVLLGNGLMASEGERWRKQRRMLQSAFHSVKIAPFLEDYYHQAGQLAERWTASARRGDRVNVTADVSESALLGVLRSLLSEDLLRLQAEQGGNPFQLVSQDSHRDLQFAVRFRALARVVQVVTTLLLVGTPRGASSLTMAR